MNVLLTGIDGYIGARLASDLVGSGHSVTGLDTGFYREGWLYSAPRKFPRQPTVICKDLRRATPADFEGFDAVVHLAELSNDPLGENDPELTAEINHRGSIEIAKKAREAGVSRFLYASSCSVYGLGTGDFLSEESPVNPQTAYARCKVLVERDLREMAGPDFCVTFLRNATAYGPSPRMRFDIVLNDLCARAWVSGKITMTSDGTPWRPVVHVEDISQAFRRCLDAPVDLVNGEVFNVGDTAHNYRIRELAEIVVSEFSGCEIETGSSQGDNRSYRVSFDKIKNKLPGFACNWDAKKGAAELHDLFDRIQLSKEMYEFRAFTRLKQLHYLQRSKQVDRKLYWRY